ncbi:MULTISPECIES: hypothetical protein [unclassified Synechocystis]|jgi:hypothetical protein|nr:MULTISPECIES: hypothetical protein [unclassified Synechocystis]MBD2616872.1 hypothetical protein [Synechocystis sp. FACHB-898]MBD2638186.1 hypothetical protein [Synechocystis sp. FACHB-908]MBD2661256.1 hypothetical protein [Synechocystis sp. FACHB-929]NHL97144.1 hypothetical protein [Synechocystis sp. PCC 6803]QWO79781.1 hypothetical protein KBZ93_12320 [Synechocystis sp. PCC 6803]
MEKWVSRNSALAKALFMGMDQILISAGQVDQQGIIGLSSAMVKANIG